MAKFRQERNADLSARLDDRGGWLWTSLGKERGFDENVAMTSVELTGDEAETLAGLISVELGSPRDEVHKTDSDKMRQYLKQGEVVLHGILARWSDAMA